MKQEVHTKISECVLPPPQETNTNLSGNSYKLESARSAELNDITEQSSVTIGSIFRGYKRDILVTRPQIIHFNIPQLVN